MITDHINQLLPASLESERGLLCSFCLEPTTVGAMMAERGITPEYFTDPFHSRLAELMQARWTDGRAINMRLVMKDAEGTEGGAITASEILTHLSTGICADEFADAVIDKRILREIILATREINDAAWLADAKSAPLFEALAQLATVAVPPKRAVPFKALLLEKLQRVENGEPDADLVPTGITLLDRESPMRLGDMPLISGERKGGKSILALSIALNVLMQDKAVLIFSLEDRSPKVVDRLFAGASRVPLIAHHKDRMAEHEFQKVSATFQTLRTKKMFIRDDVQDLASILAVTRQAKAQNPDLALCVVDYAQLVRAKVPKGSSREQEVAAVSRGLRLLAMELGIVMLVLCQLNKDGDTRESKALEQDATAMWKIIPCDPEEPNRRMIAIPFQRNGESNTALPVTFFGHIARVENCADEQ